MKKKHTITLIAAGMGALATIIAALIGSKTNSEKNLVKIGDVKENTVYISYDYGNKDTVINNNYNTVYNIGESSSENEELLMAIAVNHCKSQEYDLAVKVYSSESLSNNRIALTNLGYLYAHGFDGQEPDEQKAIDYYLKADCIEASRNLLALYLKNTERYERESIELLKDLLFIKDDDVTWDYVSLCLFDEVWEDYVKTVDIQKLEFKFDYYDLYNRWVESDEEQMGHAIPSDTEDILYLLIGWDASGGNYIVKYKECKRSYLAYIDIIDKLY